MALWVDQLLHGVIKKLSSHTDMYDGTFITTTLVGHHQILLWAVVDVYLPHQVASSLADDGLFLPLSCNAPC
jgi:hypothetical protein